MKQYRYRIILIDVIAGIALCGIIVLELLINQRLPHSIIDAYLIEGKVFEFCINFLFMCLCNTFLSKAGRFKDNVKIDNQSLGTNSSIIIMCLCFVATLCIFAI